MPALQTDEATIAPPGHRVDPWPTERPLFALNVAAALVLWGLSIISIVGIAYGFVIALFLLVLHVGFIAHLRGSGIRVSAEQLPEVHGVVTRLSGQFGMKRPPETYVIHGGGALNAFATRFVGRDIVILFSDLLDACEGDAAARDMIIGHELGHVHRGHLRWQFLIAPTMMVPFLSSASSRAREYTCDRYGLAAAANRDSAVLGLTILATGGRLARLVNRRAFAAQRDDLDTGLMTIGQWLSTHPPLSKRLIQLDPFLARKANISGYGAPDPKMSIGPTTSPTTRVERQRRIGRRGPEGWRVRPPHSGSTPAPGR